MYRGVPLMDVSTIVLHDMARAKPKSQSFTVPPDPIRMFCARQGAAGFRVSGLGLGFKGLTRTPSPRAGHTSVEWPPVAERATRHVRSGARAWPRTCCTTAAAYPAARGLVCALNGWRNQLGCRISRPKWIETPARGVAVVCSESSR